MILGKTKARKLTKQVKKLVKKHGGEAVSAYFDGLIANVTAKRAREDT